MRLVEVELVSLALWVRGHEHVAVALTGIELHAVLGSECAPHVEHRALVELSLSIGEHPILDHDAIAPKRHLVIPQVHPLRYRLKTRSTVRIVARGVVAEQPEHGDHGAERQAGVHGLHEAAPAVDG